jgi:predicted anti-sigma-YlaC factor YlaD
MVLRGSNQATFVIRPSSFETDMTSRKPGCCKVVRFLADYLERRMEPHVRAELDAHLQNCPRCLGQLRTYESTVSLLRELRDDELPPDLRLTVKSFLDARCHNN